MARTNASKPPSTISAEQRVDWDKTQGDYVLYGWYYITQAMFQGGDPYWQYWNREIRDTLIKKQRSDGRWMPPPNSTMETRELAATPAYSTALGVLILEVYYRYPPMDQLTEQGGHNGEYRAELSDDGIRDVSRTTRCRR